MKAVWTLMLLAMGSAAFAADLATDEATPRKDSETCLVLTEEGAALANQILGELPR